MSAMANLAQSRNEPDHLTHDLSVTALARQTNLSERQLSRVFKSEVGITPADHVEGKPMSKRGRGAAGGGL